MSKSIEELFEEIFNNVKEEKQIKINVLGEKTVRYGDNIFQILKLDSLSMARVLSIGKSGSGEFDVLIEAIVTHCTKNLDAMEFLTTNTFDIVNQLINEINEFNGVI